MIKYTIVSFILKHRLQMSLKIKLLSCLLKKGFMEVKKPMVYKMIFSLMLVNSERMVIFH